MYSKAIRQQQIKYMDSKNYINANILDYIVLNVISEIALRYLR